jgi:ferrous iron transport protein A
MEGNLDREPKAKALSDLSVGQTGVMRSVNATGMVRNRLLDLGFLPGTKVTVVRRAPLGDPTAYRVRGAMLALRHEDASLVAAEPITDLQAEAEQC